MLKTITVITNAVKNAAGTTSLYAESVTHNPPTITRILAASARNIDASVVPASGTARAPCPSPSRNAYATPAATLMKPPSTAEIAPGDPAQNTATTATAPVTMICHLRTV